MKRSLLVHLVRTLLRNLWSIKRMNLKSEQKKLQRINVKLKSVVNRTDKTTIFGNYKKEYVEQVQACTSATIEVMYGVTRAQSNKLIKIEKIMKTYLNHPITKTIAQEVLGVINGDIQPKRTSNRKSRE